MCQFIHFCCTLSALRFWDSVGFKKESEQEGKNTQTIRNEITLFWLGAVHKWRHHFWGVSRPPPPPCHHVMTKWRHHFWGVSRPPPSPSSDDVIYEQPLRRLLYNETLGIKWNKSKLNSTFLAGGNNFCKKEKRQHPSFISWRDNGTKLLPWLIEDHF